MVYLQIGGDDQDPEIEGPFASKADLIAVVEALPAWMFPPHEKETMSETMSSVDVFGAWQWGVDYSEGAKRVLAINVGGTEIKYGIDWMGPIDISDPEALAGLGAWADHVLHYGGGYVHLFPADGDARAELTKVLADHAEWEEEIDE